MLLIIFPFLLIATAKISEVFTEQIALNATAHFNDLQREASLLIVKGWGGRTERLRDLLGTAQLVRSKAEKLHAESGSGEAKKSKTSSWLQDQWRESTL